MASRAKTKRRAPLMESDTEAALRRRGTELVGLAPRRPRRARRDDDLDLLARRSEPVQRHRRGAAQRPRPVGASLADPLHRALGWAAYGIAAILGVWGLRFLLHAGEGRAVRRAIFAPVALLVAASFAATHVPPAGWGHEYGLGGLLGDAVLGALLPLSPFDADADLPGRDGGARGALRRQRPATCSASPGPRPAASCASSARGRCVLYSGAHGLTGRAVSTAVDGAKAGARAARDRAAETRARRADPRPSPACRAPPSPRPSPPPGLAAAAAARRA